MIKAHFVIHLNPDGKLELMYCGLDAGAAADVYRHSSRPGKTFLYHKPNPDRSKRIMALEPAPEPAPKSKTKTK